ncbi:MAG: hypothetical protein ACD_72C00508G0003 [uncultured bacterium]|nr:MAG: hypothetical protein ACD_72C00508G0003 [uncultured bacterium]
MSNLNLFCTQCSKRILLRNHSAVNPNGHNFCNHHCAASFTNRNRITRLTISKQIRKTRSSKCKRYKCTNKIGIENRIYCSNKCRKAFYLEDNIKFEETTIMKVKKFMKDNGRLPVKREFVKGYKRICLVFGTWNNLIKSAGFEPNPVMFAKKYISNDGHKCDSLSEKIVDDWLSAREIPHMVKEKYPWNNGMTVDFKVGDYWIELFGLTGQLESYDRLMKIKIKKVKKYNLNLISLFLSDIFPHNHLEAKLNHLAKIPNLSIMTNRLAKNPKVYAQKSKRRESQSCPSK